MRSEFELARKLEHPNLIGYIEMVETPEKLYLVMELAGLGDLRRNLERFQKPEQAVPVMFQCLSAVAHLHANGVEHRDVKLCDFGTAANMAPEVLGNRGATTRSATSGRWPARSSS